LAPGLEKVLSKYSNDLRPEETSEFYQALSQQLRGEHRSPERPAATIARKDLLSAQDKLLDNNLGLDQTGCNAGEGPYTWHFLCANITDEKNALEC
jgi:hypothetical protein